MLPIEKPVVSEEVAVPCPKKDFKPAMVCDSCLLCEFYDGIGVMSDDNKRPWHERYAIRCVHPIERRTKPVKFESKDIMASKLKKEINGDT